MYAKGHDVHLTIHKSPGGSSLYIVVFWGFVCIEFL